MIKKIWIQYCRLNHEEGVDSMTYTDWLNSVVNARLAAIEYEMSDYGWDITIKAKGNIL
jgi:hypothetical protein